MCIKNDFVLNGALLLMICLSSCRLLFQNGTAFLLLFLWQLMSSLYVILQLVLARELPAAFGERTQTVLSFSRGYEAHGRLSFAKESSAGTEWILRFLLWTNNFTLCFSLFDLFFLSHPFCHRDLMLAYLLLLLFLQSGQASIFVFFFREWGLLIITTVFLVGSVGVFVFIFLQNVFVWWSVVRHFRCVLNLNSIYWSYFY